MAEQQLLRVFTLSGDCGVLHLTSRFRPPSLGAPMPPHVCRWAASGVICTVRGWTDDTPEPPSTGRE